MDQASHFIHQYITGLQSDPRRMYLMIAAIVAVILAFSLSIVDVTKKTAKGIQRPFSFANAKKPVKQPETDDGPVFEALTPRYQKPPEEDVDLLASDPDDDKTEFVEPDTKTVTNHIPPPVQTVTAPVWGGVADKPKKRPFENLFGKKTKPAVITTFEPVQEMPPDETVTTRSVLRFHEGAQDVDPLAEIDVEDEHVDLPVQNKGHEDANIYDAIGAEHRSTEAKSDQYLGHEALQDEDVEIEEEVPTSLHQAIYTTEVEEISLEDIDVTDHKNDQRISNTKPDKKSATGTNTRTPSRAPSPWDDDIDLDEVGSEIDIETIRHETEEQEHSGFTEDAKTFADENGRENHQDANAESLDTDIEDTLEDSEEIHQSPEHHYNEKGVFDLSSEYVEEDTSHKNAANEKHVESRILRSTDVEEEWIHKDLEIETNEVEMDALSEHEATFEGGDQLKPATNQVVAPKRANTHGIGFVDTSPHEFDNIDVDFENIKSSFEQDQKESNIPTPVDVEDTGIASEGVFDSPDDATDHQLDKTTMWPTHLGLGAAMGTAERETLLIYIGDMAEPETYFQALILALDEEVSDGLRPLVLRTMVESYCLPEARPMFLWIVGSENSNEEEKSIARRGLQSLGS